MTETNNPLLNWINTDDKLKNILTRIDSEGGSLHEQADKAFSLISEEYDLAKFPDSFSEEDYEKLEEIGIEEPRSVYEEIAIFKFLYPQDDIRSITLVGLYNIKNHSYTDIDQCAIKHYGSKSKIPENYMIYYVGEDAQAKLGFLEENESWVDKGARYAMKFFKN